MASPVEPLREQLGAVYGALATGCSYPYRVIDGMTLAEAGEIFGYWQELSAAASDAADDRAHVRLDASPGTGGRAANRGDRRGAAPGLAVARGGDLGMPAPLDLDALRARNRASALAIARRNGTPATG